MELVNPLVSYLKSQVPFNPHKQAINKISSNEFAMCTFIHEVLLVTYMYMYY